MSKQSKGKEVRTLTADLPESLLDRHLTAMPASYFERFDAATICRHLELLARLDSDRKAALAVVRVADVPGEWDLTVAAYDYQGLLSCITCLLSTFGFDIKDAEIHSYQAGAGTDGRIVDLFRLVSVRGPSAVTDEIFGQIEQTIEAALGYLTQGRLLDALQLAGKRG